MSNILGFTGTQVGMSHDQLMLFADFIVHVKPTQFRHGDCIGADKQAHDIVRAILPDCDIIIHPPIKGDKRAFCNGDAILAPREYLDRNHDIVDCCDILIATPKRNMEELRSGTWATVRYAVKSHKSVKLILR
jgi:hypothetical protein